MSRAVLLVNLGTPRSPSVRDVRRYLDEVEIDGLDGQLAGIRGTPGFFINGQILSGAQPYAIFERMTQRELDMAGIDYGG